MLLTSPTILQNIFLQLGMGKVCSQAQEADTNSWKSQEHIDRPVEGELGPGGNGYTC